MHPGKAVRSGAIAEESSHPQTEDLSSTIPIPSGEQHADMSTISSACEKPSGCESD